MRTQHVIGAALTSLALGTLASAQTVFFNELYISHTGTDTEEFIELVKTYMTKELIMQQSKSLGINYDILSKAGVEFLFQIRSSLMHDN